MKAQIIALSALLSGAAILPTAVTGQSFRNVGHAGANFLQIPAEPVGAALGNAAVAHAAGIEGLYWNPGALAFAEGTGMIFSTVDWIIDTRISFVGASHRLPFGTIGVSLTALTMDQMEITTELEPDGTGAFFSAGSYAVGISFSRQIIDRFSFGGTVKYIYEHIWETHGSTFAFDLGSVYLTGFRNLRIGMRLANFGGDITFTGAPIDEKPAAVAQTGQIYVNDPRLDRVSKEYSLPQSFDLGIAMDAYRSDQHLVTAMISVNDPIDNAAQVSVGAEYAFDEMFFLRGGYKSGYDEQDLSVGIGLRAELMGVLLRLDYAHARFGRLGSTNFLSLRMGF